MFNEVAELKQWLEPWRLSIGRDYEAYLHHASRVFLFGSLLSGATGDDAKKMLIAAAFHDLGIWTNQTMDYLPPSITLCTKFLREAGLSHWSEEISQMIEHHHKLTPFHGSRLVEAFRKADLVDLSKRLFRFGLPEDRIKEICTTFPDHGFHGRITELVLGWGVRHPCRPLPMVSP